MDWKNGGLDASKLIQGEDKLAQKIDVIDEKLDGFINIGFVLLSLLLPSRLCNL